MYAASCNTRGKYQTFPPHKINNKSLNCDWTTDVSKRGKNTYIYVTAAAIALKVGPTGRWNRMAGLPTVISMA